MRRYLFFLGCLSVLAYSLCAAAPRMSLAPTSSYSPTGTYAFEYTISLSTPSTSAWVQVPAGVKAVSVTLSLTGGATAKVQAATDSVYNIDTSSASVIGVDWNYGVCSTNKQDTAQSITAFRLVQISTGTATLYARSQ